MDNVYDELVAAGCEVDNHYSDLYVKVTDAATAIVKRHGIVFSTFTSQIDGKRWYDLPFQYAPFWREVARKAGKP